MNSKLRSKKWINKMIDQFEHIIVLRKKLQSSPSIHNVIKFLLALGKIVFSVFLTKLIDHFF